MEKRLKNFNRPTRYLIRFLWFFSILIMVMACAIPLQGRQPAETSFPTSTPVSLPTGTNTPVPPPTITPVATTVPSPTSNSNTSPLPSAFCAANPITASVLNKTGAGQWLGWVKKLSGAEPVTVNGQEVTITTRYTPAMFNSAGPNAFDFVLQTVREWYPEDQIEVQNFTATDHSQQQVKGKNLILTLPGSTLAGEVIILSAHLDSRSNVTPEKTAPGAEDNGSGSAALLEAARLFRVLSFERSIRIIWFTGEELGLLGSKAYVKGLKNPREIQAVINLDMFGYDSDKDRCFEIHVGTLPASDHIGQCFLESNTAYNLGLPNPDYLTGNAIGGSDHSSFWEAGVGAVEILENMFDQKQPGGCKSSDMNSAYHTPQDTYDRLNPDSAIRIVRSALATAMALAGPIQ